MLGLAPKPVGRTQRGEQKPARAALARKSRTAKTAPASNSRTAGAWYFSLSHWGRAGVGAGCSASVINLQASPSTF